MKKRSGVTVMARLMALVGPLAPYMALAVGLGAAGFLCAVFLSVFGGWAMLGAAGLPAPLSVGALLALMAAAALLRGPLRWGEQACNHFIAFKLLALIRGRVFRALRRLAPAKLEGRDRGDLIAVITSDIELLEVFYAHTISPVLIAVILSAAMCGFIGWYHPLLGALAAVAYLTVGAGLPLLFARRGRGAGDALREGAGALSGFLLDSLRGLAEIRQYRRGPDRLAQLQQRTARLAEVEQGMKARAAADSGLTGAVIVFFDLCMLGAGGALYLAGAVDMAGMLTPLIALMSSFGPVIALADLGNGLQSTLAAGSRVLDILDEAPQVEEVSGQPAAVFEGMACRGVGFAYQGEEVLSDIDLTLHKGEVVGITGRSGSGKSTLLRLLMRFWDPARGEVTLSGRDLRGVNTADLRAQESLVTQETHLFHDSILNNLRVARLSATRQEVEEACKKASVHDFIMTLPQGYDTPVGELGDTLSGGERQRLGLARAFLQDAPLMLLDEPTSNLDSLNEAVILRSLQAQRGGKTVVIVSHRGSTMSVADRVCSVEGGRMS